MKTLVKTQPKNEYITWEDFKQWNLMGMEANGNRYLLNYTYQNGFSWSNGKTCWTSWASFHDFMESTLNDKRCKIVVFESFSELAAWAQG